MLDAVAILFVLLCAGAHVVVPWRSATTGETGRRLWRLAAGPLLLAGLLGHLLRVAAHPDRALAAGLGALPAGSRLAAVVSAAFLILLALDAWLAWGGERLGRRSWLCAAGLAVPSLAALAWTHELLHVGQGPAESLPMLVAAALVMLFCALAAGELVAPGRPALAPFAAVGLASFPILAPAPLRQALIENFDLLTLVAAVTLWLAARWLPASLRRWALGGGLLLAALFWSRAAALSEALSGSLL